MPTGPEPPVADVELGDGGVEADCGIVGRAMDVDVDAGAGAADGGGAEAEGRVLNLDEMSGRGSVTVEGTGR